LVRARWFKESSFRCHYDPCYDVACDTIDNVNPEVLNHYVRAMAGTLAHFATSTDELR
jgi:aminopeptidase S